MSTEILIRNPVVTTRVAERMPKYNDRAEVERMALRALERFGPPPPKNLIEKLKGAPDERTVSFWNNEVRVEISLDEGSVQESWIVEIEASLRGNGYEVDIDRFDKRDEADA